MTALGPQLPGRRRLDLLASYSEKVGDVIRRRQSMIALKAARIDAELAYRARGTFLANMNHELRTPLNAITGFAGMLKEADKLGFSSEQRQEYLDYILQSADLLLSHIDTIIQIADAESGGTKLTRRAFDLRDLVEQMTEEAKLSATEPVLFFENDMPDRLPPVDADPDKVAVALKHLIHFMSSTTKDPVTFRLTVRSGLGGKSEGFLYLALSSDAPAHTKADIDQALRVFDQVEEGLDRKFDSQRLGLPIAKSFIELNHGRFNIKTMEGTGTLIRFALPIAASDHQRTYEQLVS